MERDRRTQVVIVALALLAVPLRAQSEWDRADRDIRRLIPASFRELPAKIRQDLEARGCTIPQTWEETQPHNVVRARLADPGQVDWAVLCSRHGKSQILVYWGGKRQCPTLGEATPDRGWLQGIGDDRIGFSRRISSVDRAVIRKHHRSHGGPKPPPIRHQGLNDAYLEKGSVVHYCYRGKWIALSGAD
jgi:hypothetical protein